MIWNYIKHGGVRSRIHTVPCLTVNNRSWKWFWIELNSGVRDHGFIFDPALLKTIVVQYDLEFNWTQGCAITALYRTLQNCKTIVVENDSDLNWT